MHGSAEHVFDGAAVLYLDNNMFSALVIVSEGDQVTVRCWTCLQHNCSMGGHVLPQHCIWRSEIVVSPLCHLMLLVLKSHYVTSLKFTAAEQDACL